jgi:hypothetical protein
MLFRVDSEMFFQLARQEESLGTQGTAVAFLPRVNSHNMRLQVKGLSTGLHTLCTGVGFLSGVNFQMALQRAGLCKRLVALGTIVGLLSGVHSDVMLQGE